MDALIKELVGGLPVVEVAFLRYVAGSVLMSGVAAVTRPGVPRRDTVIANALRAVLVVVTAVAFFHALGVLPLAETLALSFVSPLFTAVLAVLLLRERLSAGIIGAIAVGFGGVLVIILGSYGPGSAAAPVADSATALLGVAAVLISAFTYAASNVLLRARAQRDPVVLIVLIQNIAPAAMLALPAWYVWRAPSGTEAMLLGLVGLLGTGGHLLLARAYAKAEAVRLAPLEYTALIWAVALGFFAFAEVPTMWALLGSALIVFGAYAGSRPRR
ncbi:MAG: transporter [Enterovirga sp.]|nr:transporter [Enterovirga sp.]